ncbi:MAG: D-alanyl-lipoteichoic acid acyltransferase DltB (MBOAT superfamily) [Rickettsiales bacterium]|jgi:D-alanyl-lipoteichoic acid acyltransferase DltB (MBOAT superfamily)
MQFQSFNFLLIFLPLVISFYYLAKNNNYRNIILIFFSFIFYAWGNIWWFFILLISASVDFFIAKKIYQLGCKMKSPDQAASIVKINFQRKSLLILSIVSNVGLLVFFKYWDWLISASGSYFSANFDFLIHNIGLPVAISFYTFESLSYIFDVYRRQFKATDKYIDYLTFIAFFPKLVAGPIMRAHELLPQLAKIRHKISNKNLELALFLIAWGLCKKLVFADNLGYLVEDCHKNIKNDGVGFILGVAFTLQIYCDFSAYCDIARGVAKFFSINLKRNFLTPYFSKNISEFFTRWHISLSSWVKDYIYLTIRKKESGQFNRLIGLYVAMLVIGIWHGAGIFFIFYGLYAATVILIYRISKIDKILIKFLGNNFGGLIAIILCFLAIVFGMTIFWVKDYDDFLRIVHSYFAFFTFPFSPSKISVNFLDLGYQSLFLILPILFTDYLGYRKKREFVDLYFTFTTPIKIVIYISIFYLTLFFAARGSYDFIYFQF